MQSSGFTNAGLSKYLLVYTVVSAAALAIFDCKHLVNIQVSPHLWQYGQLWRVVVWQVAGFANSTEVLFAAILIYHMRPVERAWGRRKTAVRHPFCARMVWPLCSVLTPPDFRYA